MCARIDTDSRACRDLFLSHDKSLRNVDIVIAGIHAVLGHHAALLKPNDEDRCNKVDMTIN